MPQHPLYEMYLDISFALHTMLDVDFTDDEKEQAEKTTKMLRAMVASLSREIDG